MLKIRRILSDEELDEFIAIRDKSGDKAAARYMATLKDELFEIDKETINKKIKK